MSTFKKADQETLKALNRQMILDLIRSHKEISRIDLSKHTNLSPTTVSAIISELVQNKLVTELRIGESNGGRKPLILGINPNAKFVATVIFRPNLVELATLDLNYKTVNCIGEPCMVKGAGDLERVLHNGLKELLDQFPFEAENICGIGVSIPGVVEHNEGKVLYSSKLKLNNFDLSSFIREHFDRKAYIFRDTDALILGEHAHGIGNAYKNFIYINIDDGIGMAYINSGRLFQQGYGGGLELGHITIDSNGPLCRCGNRGCLGAVVSELPVVSKLEKLVEKGYETIIEEDISKLSLYRIVQYSNKGDRACRYVLEEQARILGTAIASVINLFNPQLIAIGGPYSKCRWEFLEILKDTVKDRALEIYSRNTEIRFARLGEESASIGMADEIFEREIFKSVRL